MNEYYQKMLNKNNRFNDFDVNSKLFYIICKIDILFMVDNVLKINLVITLE